MHKMMKTKTASKYGHKTHSIYNYFERKKIPKQIKVKKKINEEYIDNVYK